MFVASAVSFKLLSILALGVGMALRKTSLDGADIVAGSVGGSAIGTGAIGATQLDDTYESGVQSDAADAGTAAAEAAIPGALAEKGIHEPVMVVASAALPSYTGGGTNTLTGSSNGRLQRNGSNVSTNQRILQINSSVDAGLWKVSVQGDGSTPFVLVRPDDADTTAKNPEGSTVYDGPSQKLYRLANFPGALGSAIQTWEEVQEGIVPFTVEATGDGSNLTFALGVSGATVTRVSVNDAEQLAAVGSVSGTDYVFGSGNAPANGHAVFIEGYTRS